MLRFLISEGTRVAHKGARNSGANTRARLWGIDSFRGKRRKAAFAANAASTLEPVAQNGLIFASPFVFFFLLEDSSLRSAFGAFFFLASVA
jgi:hypothetical protein